MIESIIQRTHFSNTKLFGTNFAESSLMDVLFSGCFANYSSFSISSLKQVRFKETILIKNDFYELKWKNLYFNHCELNGISLMQTNLNALDLSFSTFEKVGISLDLLKGLTLSSIQTLVIANTLGRKIKQKTQEMTSHFLGFSYSLLCCRIIFCCFIPVDYIPKSFDVIWTNVFII
ncbi:Pentapeptide repeat-containing protein [Carnobacterium iners]|nr:Pentapeptide repeat-containing protein [Carnobacterium iners]